VIGLAGRRYQLANKGVGEVDAIIGNLEHGKQSIPFGKHGGCEPMTNSGFRRFIPPRASGAKPLKTVDFEAFWVLLTGQAI
jgi:hypothetical protein